MTDSEADAGKGMIWKTGLATFGGVAGAFGVAACCALPLALAALGLGVGWLSGIALLASPYRAPLMLLSAGSLAFALWQWTRMQRAAWRAGAGGGSPGWIRMLLLALIAGGAALLIAGYLYA